MAAPEHKTILLVEDEALIAMMETQDLENEGYTVIQALSGEKAIEIVSNNNKIDLILMDIDLGKGMDGTEVAQKILFKHDIPVVFLSSHIEKELVNKTEKITSYGYVIKNSGITILIASIKMAFRLHEAYNNIRIKNMEIEAANIKLTQSQNELIESEAFLKAEFENSPDLIMILDRNYKYQSINRIMFGSYAVEELIGQDAIQTLPPHTHDLARKKIAECFNTGTIQEFEHEVDSDRWVRARVVPLPSTTSDARVMIISTDITEQKKAVKALQESEELYRTLFDLESDAILLIDNETRCILSANVSAASLYGYTSEELLTKKNSDLSAEPEKTEQITKETPIIPNNIITIPLRFHRKKDGTIFPVEITGRFFNYKNRSVHIAAIRDITERTKSEDALKKNRERFQKLFDNMLNGLAYCKMIFDNEEPVDFIYLKVNEAFEKLTGLKNVAGKRVTEVIPGIRKNDPKLFEIYGRVSILGIPETFEMYVKSLNMWFHVSVYCPEKEHFVAIFDVITERKNNEIALKENEKLLSMTLQSIGDAVIATDVNGYITRMNKTAELLTGWKFTEIKNKPLKEVFKIINADTRAAVDNPVKLVLERGEIIGLANHTILINRNGKEYQIADSAAPIKDNQGNIMGVILVFSDITEKYEDEKKIRESQRQYKSLIEEMVQGLAVHEVILNENNEVVDYRFLEINNSFEKLTGLKRENIIGKTVLEVLPNTEKYWIDNYGHVATTGEALHFENYSRELEKYYDVIAYRPRLNQFAVIFSDITDRKLAEQELLKTQLLLKSSIESPKDMIILSIDKNYKYLYFNNTHRQVMKNVYSIDVEIGMNILDCISSDDDRLKAKINYDRALSGESHSTIEEYGDTQRAYYESFYNPIYNDTNEIIGATAYAMNITDRKLAEKKINDLLAEKEILLKEVHHRIKNNMSAIESVLLLQTRTYKNPEILSVLQDTISRMKSMRLLYDKLNQSDNFREISIMDYLTRMIDEIVSMFPHKLVRIEKHIDDFTINTKLLFHLGIIINELITNAMKHAFSDTDSGLIVISASRHDNFVTLIIQDNGKGISENFDIKSCSGFGLKLVNMLSEQISNSIKIERDNGTKFILQFNI